MKPWTKMKPRKKQRSLQTRCLMRLVWTLHHRFVYHATQWYFSLFAGVPHFLIITVLTLNSYLQPQKVVLHQRKLKMLLLLGMFNMQIHLNMVLYFPSYISPHNYFFYIKWWIYAAVLRPLMLRISRKGWLLLGEVDHQKMFILWEWKCHSSL